MADLAGTNLLGAAPANGVFLVGDGSSFVLESGDTARTSLGLGRGDGGNVFDTRGTFFDPNSPFI